MPRHPTPPDPRTTVGASRRRWAWGLGCAALVVVLPALGLRALLAGLHSGGPKGAPQAAVVPRRTAPLPTEGGCSLRLRAAPEEAYRVDPNQADRRARFVFDPGGATFTGAVDLHLDYGEEHDPVRRTLPLGEVGEVDGLPCGVSPRVFAEGEGMALLGLPPWRIAFEEGDIIELPLSPRGRVRGSVVDPDGRPVEGALVEVGVASAVPRAGRGLRLEPVTPAPRADPRWGLTRSDAAGRFELWPPVGRSASDFGGQDVQIVVLAVAEGYLPAKAPVPLGPDTPTAELTLTLPELRGVVVRCVGFPFESCPDLTCGGPLTPGVLGGGCAGRFTALLPEGDGLDPGAALCACPDALAVVRGGGLEVSVPDDTDEVVLVSPGGSIRGAVRDWPTDSWGQISAVRVAPDLARMVADVSVSTYADIQPDGTWVLTGLGPGDWALSATEQLLSDARAAELGIPTHQGSWDFALVKVPALAPGEDRDVGTIDPAAFGAVGLECMDDLSGTPVRGPATMREGGRWSPAAIHPAWCGMVNGGIPPGVWTIERLPAVWDSATIEVHAGRTTLVTLGGGDAQDPLAEAGAALSVDREGLLVDAVLPDSLAAGLGLRAGDRVRGVQVAGAPLPLDQLIGEGGELEAISGLVGLAQELGAEGGLDALGISLEVERAEGGEVVALPVRLGEEEEQGWE